MKMHEPDDFITYLKGQQFSPATLMTSRSILHYYLAWVTKEGLEPEQVSYQDLLGFMRCCNQKGLTQRTLQHYLNTVHHYYDYLEVMGHVSVNPTLGLEVKGVKKQVLYPILDPHELHRLYHQYPTATHRDRRNKVLLGLLVYQGLRAGELFRLSTHSVQLREGKIDVMGSKKHNGRLMPLSSHQLMDLYDYLQKVRPAFLQMAPKRKTQTKVETDRLFIGAGGNCYSLSNLMTPLMARVRKMNTKVQHAQQLRASVITGWVKVYSLRKAQYLAGHRYLSSTEWYLKNDLEGLQEAIHHYHPLG